MSAILVMNKKEVSDMYYAIDPAMSYADAVLYYSKYIKEAKAQGKKPVSFLHFITGRF